MQQEMARLAGAVLLRQFFRPTGQDVGRGEQIVDCGLRILRLRIADCGLWIPAFRTRIILLNFIWFTHTFSFAFGEASAIEFAKALSADARIANDVSFTFNAPEHERQTIAVRRS